MSWWPPGFTAQDRATLNGLAATLKAIQQTLELIMSEQERLAADEDLIQAGIGRIVDTTTAINDYIAQLKAGSAPLDLGRLDQLAANLGSAVDGLQTVLPAAPPA